MPLRHISYTFWLFIGANTFFVAPVIGQTQRELERQERVAGQVEQRAAAKPLEAASYEIIRSTSVFEEPSGSSRKVATIQKGTKVTVVRSVGEWLEVRSTHGNPPGFIRREDAMLIQRTATYQPCIDGPEMLRKIDSSERDGIRYGIDWHITWNATGQPLTVEQLAEIYIADCSRLLARLSAGATVTQSPALSGATRLFQENLDYMKWWLQNRREKSKQ